MDGENVFVISQFPNPEKQEMMMGGGAGQGANSGDPNKSKSPKASDEKSSNFDGEPQLNRPSDTGGQAEGAPASGTGTTQSKKALVTKDEQYMDDNHKVPEHEKKQNLDKKPAGMSTSGMKKSKKKKTYKITKHDDGTTEVEVDE